MKESDDEKFNRLRAVEDQLRSKVAETLKNGLGILPEEQLPLHDRLQGMMDLFKKKVVVPNFKRFNAALEAEEDQLPQVGVTETLVESVEFLPLCLGNINDEIKRINETGQELTLPELKKLRIKITQIRERISPFAPSKHSAYNPECENSIQTELGKLETETRKLDEDIALIDQAIEMKKELHSVLEQHPAATAFLDNYKKMAPLKKEVHDMGEKANESEAYTKIRELQKANQPLTEVLFGAGINESELTGKYDDYEKLRKQTGRTDDQIEQMASSDQPEGEQKRPRNISEAANKHGADNPQGSGSLPDSDPSVGEDPSPQ